ncbi:MAG: DUF1588 domain-containing protein, partial [Verrucomicrobia bacterium]|nr:DUF1588 domain-containing protein [Verrucomicrobiota bacterium]
GDSIGAEFDTLASSLGMSSAHFIALPDAADHVINHLLPASPRFVQSGGFTGREWKIRQERDAGASMRRVFEWSVRTARDSAILFARSSHHPWFNLELPRLNSPGRYRVVLRGQALQSTNRPIAVALLISGLSSDQDPELRRILAIRDVPPGGVTDVKFEVDVPIVSPLWKTRTLMLVPWTLSEQPHPSALEAEALIGGRPGFDGPALEIASVRLEGPLGATPDPAYLRLFGDLRLESDRMRIRREGGRPLTDRELRALTSEDWARDPLRLRAASPAEEVTRFVSRALPVVIRRTPTQAELMEFQDLVMGVVGRGGDLHEAVRAGLQAMLCSAGFLLHAGPPGTLDREALANRLSFCFWGRPPDPGLRERASRSDWPLNPGLGVEVGRLLGDPKAAEFAEAFGGRWLGLNRLNETLPDRAYGEFDDDLLWSMPRETVGFFREVLENDHSVRTLVASDWGWLNGRLARHYSVPNVHGMEFGKVNWPAGSRRGGVITHASILKLTANGTTTSPVLRGKWILDRILGQPPTPPPPGTPAIEPDIRGASTVREQLDLHRKDPSCNRCHRLLDPPGFALENFDVIGGWRDWYRVLAPGGQVRSARLPHYPHLAVNRGREVETRFVADTGEVFDGPDALRSHLLRREREIAEALAGRFITYATGAPPQFADREEIRKAVARALAQGGGLRTLLKCVVETPMFLER